MANFLPQICSPSLSLPPPSTQSLGPQTSILLFPSLFMPSLSGSPVGSTSRYKHCPFHTQLSKCQLLSFALFPLPPFSSHSEEPVPLDIKWSNVHRAGREVWVKHPLQRRLQRRSAAQGSRASRTDAATDIGFPQICFTHAATSLYRISARNRLLTY